MKRKTSPKTIRFNLDHLKICLEKSGLVSYQELVDFLLDEYSRGDFKNARELPGQKLTIVDDTKEPTKAELLKSMFKK